MFYKLAVNEPVGLLQEPTENVGHGEGLRVLNSSEIDEVSGGIAPLIIAWGVGFAAGMAYGAYLAK